MGPILSLSCYHMKTNRKSAAKFNCISYSGLNFYVSELTLVNPGLKLPLLTGPPTAMVKSGPLSMIKPLSKPFIKKSACKIIFNGPEVDQK